MEHKMEGSVEKPLSAGYTMVYMRATLGVVVGTFTLMFADRSHQPQLHARLHAGQLRL